MLKHKFKNPRVNNQYRKPACHTDYCFQRRACCNNYRCCVCHCCLEDFKVYSKAHDGCIGNITYTMTSEDIVTKAAPTSRGTTVQKAEKPKNTDSKRKRFASTITEKSFLHPTKTIDVLRKTEKKKTKHVVFTEEVKTTFQAWQPTINKSRNSQGKVGYSKAVRDDKTSTIAGVAVALALVAIVAIVIVVVVCSRKKRQKRSKTSKPEASGNDAAVVTIPLTIENVSDKFRDVTGEGSVSDTTLDSNLILLKTAEKANNSYANGKLCNTSHGLQEERRRGKERKRSGKNRGNSSVDEHRNCDDVVHRICNGTTTASNETSSMLPVHGEEASLNNHSHLSGAVKYQHNGHNLHVRNGSVECDV